MPAPNYRIDIGRATPDEYPILDDALGRRRFSPALNPPLRALAAIFVYKPKLDDVVAEADASVKGLR
jgi:hypothetical protein